jgi:hypothetical protein
VILIHPFEVEDLFYPSPPQLGARRRQRHSDECCNEPVEVAALYGCLRTRIDGVVEVRVRWPAEPTDSGPS